MSKITKWLSYLLSPFFIGLIITLFIVKVAINFYVLRNSSASIADQYDESSTIQQFLYDLHMNSIDTRFRIRGEREVSDRLALLTVDEKAVNMIGRFPWPRHKIAHAVEEARRYGAEVLAFDIVFAEPTYDRAREYLKEIAGHENIPDSLREDILRFSEMEDSDQRLADTVSRHADHLVMGAFNESTQTDGLLPFQQACTRIIFETTSAHTKWQTDEYTIPAINKYRSRMALDFPHFLKGIYKLHLSDLAKDVALSLPDPKNRIERIRLEMEQKHRQMAFCFEEFLNPDKDPYFNELEKNFDLIKQEEEHLLGKFQSFREWVDYFKKYMLPSAVVQADHWVMNIDTISNATKHTGYFNTNLDPDGTIRRKTLIQQAGEFYVPSTALQAYLVAFDRIAQFNLEEFLGALSVQDFKILDDEGNELFELPVDLKGQLTLNYAGPSQMFPYVSLAELFTDSDQMEYTQRVRDPDTGKYSLQLLKANKKDFFKDKIFVVGATALGIFDLRVTPFEENYPGAETHLNLIDNIVQQNFMVSHPEEETWMILTLLFLGVVLSVIITKLGAIASLLVTLLILGSIIIFDQHFLFEQGILIVSIFPVILTAFLYTGLTVYKYFTEERGKKELRSTFQKYVSPAIVEEVLADPHNIELGGRKAHLTVFFSDIRGFTSISEKLDPKILSDLLNSYLTPMTNLVFKNKGTLDKYMGDAVMAFFGAPISYKDHAKYACRCALQSLEELEHLQKKYREKGLPMIDIGIGINTGDCSVGNMGSESVRNYTVMGDSVNLGSRLEGINKQYGTRIIISEFTFAEVKDEFTARPVDLVQVKGKAKPVQIYELIKEGVAEGELGQRIRLFEKAYQSYHARDFDQALEWLSQVLDLDPADPVAKIYVERCQNYKHSPPPENWNGVFVMTSK